jgi:anti-anti-sigma regulatory factor
MVVENHISLLIESRMRQAALQRSEATPKKVKNKSSVKKAPAKKTAAKNDSSKKAKKTAKPVQKKNGTNEVKEILLPAYLDTMHSENFLKMLKKETGKNPGFSKVILKCENVERITTSCVQILIAYKRYIEANGIEFVTEGLNDIFESSLKDLGFENNLQKREM